MPRALPLQLLGVVAASCLASAASSLPSLKAERWVNSASITAETLRGKVVLVDFWEYTCVNWIRTAPYVKAWNRDYAPLGLVVIGVHAPEFEFGKRAENIDRGIRDHGLPYPIAIDNDFAVWRAFGNDAWPAKYLFDSRGRLVRRWVGEGSYDEIEGEIRRLLVAAQPGISLPAVSAEASTFAKTGQPPYAGISDQSARRPDLSSEEIRGDKRLPMRAQKCPPRHRPLAARWNPLFSQDLGDRGSRDAMIQVLQRTLDARVAPAGIVPCHPDHQATDLHVHTGPTRLPLRVRPLPCNQLSVPSENRIRGDDRRDLRENPTPKPLSENSQPAPFVVRHQRSVYG
jgi:thiol-disulfide isomerase/thioredoxin